MYYINHIPFTFDDVPESLWYDKEVLEAADKERRYEPEDLYRSSFYLIDEECHPMMFELDLVNPEILPQEWYENKSMVLSTYESVEMDSLWWW